MIINIFQEHSAKSVEHEGTPEICLFHNRFECNNYKICLDIGLGLLILSSFNSKFYTTTDIISTAFKEKLSHLNMVGQNQYTLKIKRNKEDIIVNKKSLKKHWIRLRNFCRQFEKFCKASIFTIFSIRDLRFIVDKNIDFTTDVKLCDCNNLCTCEVSKENITLRFREVYFKLVLLKCNNILVSE